MNLRTISISVFALASMSAPAFADEAAEAPIDGARDNSIVVVATGSAARISETGQSVSVVDAREIASIQGPDVTRVLSRLPGVSIARTGPLGSQTSVFVRGASSEQLLVVIDGARVTDVAAPGGGYDFANLFSGGIDKIELLRGSNSLVWGSEAIAGVLAVTSRQPDGVEASAEYGSNQSFDGQASAGLAGDRYSLAITGGYSRSDGTASASAAGTEDDGFRQWRIAGRGRFEFTPGLAATISGRYADGRADLDGYDANFDFVDTPEYLKTREISGRGGLEYTSGKLDIGVSFAASQLRRNYFYDGAFSYGFKGERERAELRGQYRATDTVRLDFGADHEWTRMDDQDQKARIASGHALLGWYGERLTLAAGVRLDDHSRFGSQWTFGANGSFTVVDDVRIKASYGEGFKAPTLYQLFSEYGNEALAPERSRSYEIGIEKGDRNAPLHFAATAFRRDSRNLIDYVSCFGNGAALCSDGRYGYYDNVARARSQGFEVELGAQVSERFRAQAVYSYLKAKNRSRGDFYEGNDLARRPRHSVNVSADWTTPLADLALGGDVTFVGERFDNANNVLKLESYALVTLRASLPVAERFELFGRVENVTDENYRSVAGYGTPGRTAYAGVRAKF